LGSNDKVNRNAQKFYYTEKEPSDGCSKSYSGYKFGNFVLTNKQRDISAYMQSEGSIVLIIFRKLFVGLLKKI
jgi:hypothetical protein